jgi:hypothetical protein
MRTGNKAAWYVAIGIGGAASMPLFAQGEWNNPVCRLLLTSSHVELGRGSLHDQRVSPAPPIPIATYQAALFPVRIACSASDVNCFLNVSSSAMALIPRTLETLCQRKISPGRFTT